jgi:excinuclease ABC subunit C
MDRFKFITDIKFEELPKTSGVYSFWDKKELLYIGKAINIKDRVKNHFQQPSYRDNLFIDKVNRIGYLETNSEIEALITEANLIKKHQPKFNVVWKDDKNYFYVAITNSDCPIVYITHQKTEDAEYIGPFIEGTPLKKTLKFLRRAFPYYTSKKHPKNKCTWCHLGLCPGPLLFENPPSPEATAGLLEYRRNLKKLTLILQGKRSAVLNLLKREMAHFSKEHKFEEAGKIRDRINNLQQIMSHTGVIETTKTSTLPNAGITLAKITNLKSSVARVECYDISNIQGKFATGSMVVFTEGEADKSQYKKFRIRMENEPNDIAMLKEILQRRFTHPEWKYPEVILIDGGIAQLNIAISVKNEKPETKGIKVISIAKRNKDLYIEGREDFIPLKTLPREIYNFVLQLDDEAHRFAITYHKKLRKESLLK